MDRFRGKVAVVTGASVGIGAAICVQLVNNGMHVVGLARREEKVQELSKTLKGPGKLYARKADMTKEADIVSAMQWAETIGPIHVLVNNAGVIVDTGLLDGNVDKWRTCFETNVIGLCTASKEAIKIMKKHDIAGHIVNINSVVGHKAVYMPGMNVYCASKHAVTVMTEMFRMELLTNKSGIKVTSVSPGAVKTAMMQGVVDRTPQFQEVEMPHLESDDIAKAVIFALDTPPRVQIYEIIIKPLGEMF